MRVSERLRRWCSRNKTVDPGPGLYDWVFVGRTVTLKGGVRWPLLGLWIKAWRN